jgi:hypothetical protein
LIDFLQDWTVKLWRPQGNSKKTEQPAEPVPTSRQPRLNSTAANSKPNSTAPRATIIAPIYSFEEADDYIFDVKWHPCHPAMFGTVDGSGKFNLWNLNSDTEVSQTSLLWLLIILLIFNITFIFLRFRRSQLFQSTQTPLNLED